MKMLFARTDLNPLCSAKTAHAQAEFHKLFDNNQGTEKARAAT